MTHNEHDATIVIQFATWLSALPAASQYFCTDFRQSIFYLKPSAMRKYLLLIFCAITVSFAFSQPITGIKTIPGDYPTIASAVNMLNINGTAAPGVTFNVASGYLENGLNITLSTTSSNAAAPIVFQKATPAIPAQAVQFNRSHDNIPVQVILKQPS